jgi:RNA polymerase sigma-70 factor (ECF subfamily)
MEDVELARRAAAGDGDAFAVLYDRHERRAYNLCYRITGSADDAADATQETFLKMLERLPSLAERELNFGSYLLTAARHASYDAIDRRRRAAPAAEIPDSAVPVAAGAEPEAADREALRAAHQEDIRAANALLPVRQREALALRELGELSYDEVAEVMGMNRNSVAQLISRARLNLRDGLRRGALVSIPAATPDCEAALPLLALAQDDMLDDATHADWLARHLAGCATCRVRVEALEEAGAAYRQWLPLVPALWLRSDVAEAAERTSARSTSTRGRRLALAAAAGVLLVLAAAEIVQAPGRAPSAEPAPPPVVAEAAAPAAVASYQAKPRAQRRHTLKAKPVRVAAAAAPVPESAGTPAPVSHAARVVRRRPPPRRVAAKPEPKPRERVAEETAPVPTATPEPVVVSDPPPDPPEPTGPTCPSGATATQVPGCPQPPPPPPKPPVCPNCGIVAAPPPQP